MDNETVVSVAQAAEELATTQVKVLMLLKQKDLEGELVNDEWAISRDSLECLKKHGIKPTSQNSCRTSCQASSCGCH